MVWQNGGYTDTTLNPGELIAMIKAKKSRICYIDCVVHLHSTAALRQLLSSAFQRKCEELNPSFVA